MTIEQAKDNQWWFSKSSHRQRVESARYVELSIAGRKCLLERSADGRNGMPTLSFKFLRDDDRKFWRELNGCQVEIKVLDVFQSPPFYEDDPIDEVEKDGFNDAAGIISESTVGDMRQVRCNNVKPIFDAYIFVDWSANNTKKTGKDSIWISEAWWSDQELVWNPGEAGCLNISTREIATQHIQKRLTQHVRNQRRALVCFDFAYAYPVCEESAAFAKDFEHLWSRLSNMINDDSENRSNRFQVGDQLNQLVSPTSGEGPFWGRPTTGVAKQLQYLVSTKPKVWNDRKDLKEFRVVEERLRLRGSRPFSTWQLFGNGSVGSQVLLGIPRVQSLRNADPLSVWSKVWPFETGWTTSFADDVLVVHAEFWPGAIELDESLHPIRDAAQVLSCAVWAAHEDSCGRLGAFFDPLPETDPDRHIATREGWILGFVDRRP
jgi:hypothetical protein